MVGHAKKYGGWPCGDCKETFPYHGFRANHHSYVRTEPPRDCFLIGCLASKTWGFYPPKNRSPGICQKTDQRIDQLRKDIEEFSETVNRLAKTWDTELIKDLKHRFESFEQKLAEIQKGRKTLDRKTRRS
jgi:septal ring factor EnvC (AmiA/AmiB activator)